MVRSRVTVRELCPVPNYTNDKPLSGEIFESLKKSLPSTFSDDRKMAGSLSIR